MQNQHYAYAAIGAAIIIVAGLFIWAQPANAPTDGEEDMQQSTTTQEQVDEQSTEQTSESAQNNQSDLDFLKDSASQTSSKGNNTDTGSGNTQGATANTDTQADTASTEEARENEQTSNPTADWRTYTNAGLGITFKIPSDWAINEHSQIDEFTLQAHTGDDNTKTAEFNLLFYSAELDRTQEGSFSKTVNGYEAYVDTNQCPSDTRCVLKQVIFPLEEGETVGDNWNGDVLEASAITHEIATNELRTTFDNILSTLTITEN